MTHWVGSVVVVKLPGGGDVLMTALEIRAVRAKKRMKPLIARRY